MLTEQTPNRSDLPSISISRLGKFDPLLGRVDLLASLMSLVVLCVLGIAGVGMAGIELAKLMCHLWVDPVGRWFVIALSLALVWVFVRGKKLCVY